MKVSVKTLKGNHFDIEVQPTDTVLNVKKQIEQTQGAQTYPSEQQMLIYQGRVLKDGTTIEENKVSENAFLVLSKMLTERDIWESDPQDPCTAQFTLHGLKWSKVKVRNRIHNVAVIPRRRVEDFVNGEGSLAECKFGRSSRRLKEEGSAYKPRVDASLEYTVYKCSYGRPSTTIGCQCQFTVRRRRARSDVAMISYNHRRHVDKSGSICCHGPRMWNRKKRRTAGEGNLKLKGE